MSSWMVLRNAEPAGLDALPLLAPGDLIEEVVTRCEEGERPVALFGSSQGGEGLLVIVALADDRASRLSLASMRLARSGRGSSYPSLTSFVPGFHHFERELFEEHGVEPTGHPWLKPVRYPRAGRERGAVIERYPFFQAEGEGIHEVAVGPVHAGVIEPGHFRFMCRGETVDHLEIQLGYQHRGVEALFESGPVLAKAPLAESIAGDSSVAHTTAYLLGVEALAGLVPAPMAMRTRAVALELERIALHLGTLSALAGDVGYLTGSSLFGGTRTIAINATLAVCGSRFGRGWLRPGGDRSEIDGAAERSIHRAIDDIEARTRIGAEVMFNSPSVLSRFQGTGRVGCSIAAQIGMVGLAARASGLARDVRHDHPIAGSPVANGEVITLDSGDVYARAYLRFLEIGQSIGLIRALLAGFSPGVSAEGRTPAAGEPLRLAPNRIVLSLVEGHRGEIVHAMMTDDKGGCMRYKIKDPSFNNWFGLTLAVRGEGISDFPLCNKSFDLSYAGHDL